MRPTTSNICLQFVHVIHSMHSLNSLLVLNIYLKTRTIVLPLVLVTKIHRPKNKTVHSKFTNNLLSKWPSSGQTISSLGCLLTILTLQAVESVFPLNHFTIWLHAWHTHTHTSQSVTEIIKNKFVH